MEPFAGGQLHDVARQTLANCAAILTGPGTMLLFTHGSSSFSEGSNGTVTFVEWEGRCYAVTNHHVLDRLLRAYESGDLTYSAIIALGKHTPLGCPLACTPESLESATSDLAIFCVDKQQLLASGKAPIPLSNAQSNFCDGELGMALGFYAQGRAMKDAMTMSHGLCRVIARCTGAANGRFTLSDIPESGPKPIRFGGMSGGPVYRLVDEMVEFIGIVDEGWGHADVLPGEELRHDVGIRGFVLAPTLIGRTIELGMIDREDLARRARQP